MKAGSMPILDIRQTSFGPLEFFNLLKGGMRMAERMPSLVSSISEPTRPRSTGNLTRQCQWERGAWTKALPHLSELLQN